MSHTRIIGATVVVGALTLVVACGGDDAVGGPASTAEPVTTVVPSPQDLATYAPSYSGPTNPPPGTSTVGPPTTLSAGQLPHLPATTTPTTTIPGQPAPPPPTIRTLSAADEAEPTCAEVLAESVDDGGVPGPELLRLEPMLGQLVAYSQLHPDVFGGYGLVWHGPDDGSAFVGITEDVAAHREALEAAVEHPDELVVCRSPLSEAERSALTQALQPELHARGLAWGGSGDGALHIQLRADQEAYAAELHDRYGEMLQLTVGAFPYPMPDRPPDATCEPLPAGRTVDGLEAVVEPPGAPLHPDDQGQMAVPVRLRNIGTAELSVSFGQPTAVLLAPGTDRIIGTYTGGVASFLDVVRLHPGEEATRDALVGAATCDPSMGYALLPGPYDLVVVLEGTVMDGPPILTPRITVELAAS